MAGSSKKLVYLPQVCQDSWLLWSKRRNTVYLRRYAPDILGKPPAPIALTFEKATQYLNKDGKEVTNPSFNTISFHEILFWLEWSNALNVKHRLVTRDSIKKFKLQTAFTKQCRRPLTQGRTNELKGLFDLWVSSLGAIKNKTNRLNDYDHKDTTNIFTDLSWGKTWQSQLLEASRRDGKVNCIQTGNEMTDFSFAAMELTLAISARDNPFFPETESRISPDGLGVRSNGFLTVIEVKGPKDERDLLNPLLQATCGALAVIALRDNLCQMLIQGNDRRPKYKKARVPDVPSIGIHILTSKHKERGELEAWSPARHTLCRRVLEACPQLKYIAYSFIVPEQTENFTKLKVDHLIPQK